MTWLDVIIKHSPFVGPGPDPEEAGLRRALSLEGPGTPGWHAARLALADYLTERNDPEQWLARLPWEYRPRQSREDVMFHYWAVSIPPAMPFVFFNAAQHLEGRVNATHLLGWGAGKLRMGSTRGSSLHFSSLATRRNPSHADVLGMPGGFKGLAWLYWHLLDTVPAQGVLFGGPPAGGGGQ
jgi:hypothetical protein